MTFLGWVSSVSLVAHIASITALMALLIHQLRKSPPIVHPGALHSALTALLAGLIMVGVRTSLHNEDPTKWELLNNGKIGVKFVVLLLILFIGYRNVKKTEVKKSTLYTMISLTTLNILLALFW
jgi:hypothetical protein